MALILEVALTARTVLLPVVNPKPVVQRQFFVSVWCRGHAKASHHQPPHTAMQVNVSTWKDTRQ